MNNRIKVIKGDITQQETEAIVNAANNSLLGGGGVDGAIHTAAGLELLEYNRKLNGCATGEAKIAPGFKLRAKHIIHTVGPIWKGGAANEAGLLADCYRSVFKIVDENNIRSLSIPSMSTGVYNYPLEQAVQIAIRETQNFLKSNDMVEEVVFVCFDDATYNAYNKHLS